MRTVKDRLRHTLCFEILGVLLITPLGAWFYGTPVHDIGVVAIVSATLATGWTYFFNLLFDHALLRLRGTTQKTLLIRVGHTLLFEGGLVIVLMPFIAWYLGVSLLTALLMDVSFTVFYLFYAFFYNWAYDVIFPVPAPAPHPAAGLSQPRHEAADTAQFR